MFLKIDQDHYRFREIIRGRIKKELRKFMTKGELIGRMGKNVVSIPLPQIDIPHLTYGLKQRGGVGQGDGAAGTVIGVGEAEGEGKGKAGNLPGEHVLEVDVTLDELAQIMAEELELPRIQPKGVDELAATKIRYSSIGVAGPESLRHFKRTYREALKRQIMAGTYNASNPIIHPVREDRRYRLWKETRKQHHNAVIIMMMDVSGSMGHEQKEIVRQISFWIDTWIRSQYKGVERRYIVHDAVARVVDEEAFYHTKESGGTIISSAYKLCLQLMEQDFPPADWNIYPFHFSDGDNWSGTDTQECLALLGERMLGQVNLFSYGQVESEYGSGQFIKDLKDKFSEDPRVTTAKIPSKEAVFDTLKVFLGKGK